MQWQRVRAGASLALAALVPTLTACYEYVPIATATPPVGQLVELQVSGRGRGGLGDRFGPGVQLITGRLVSEQGNDLVVSVTSVKNIDGETTQWSRDTTRVDKSFIATVKGRQFSTTRTVLIALAGGAAVYLIVSSKLLGAFSDSKDDGETGPPVQATRIPVVP
jgi:hypothetical protein